MYHEEAASHSAIILCKFLTKNKTDTIQLPSNLRDMATCGFFLFGRVKKSTKKNAFLQSKGGSGKIEDDSGDYTENRVPRMFRELEKSLA